MPLVASDRHPKRRVAAAHSAVKKDLRGKITKFDDNYDPSSEYPSIVDATEIREFKEVTELYVSPRWKDLSDSKANLLALQNGVLAVVARILAELGSTDATAGLTARLSEDVPGSICICRTEMPPTLDNARFIIHVATKEMYDQHDDFWRVEISAIYGRDIFETQPERRSVRGLFMTAQFFQLVQIERGSDGARKLGRAQYTRPISYHIRPDLFIRVILGLATQGYELESSTHRIIQSTVVKSKKSSRSQVVAKQPTPNTIAYYKSNSQFLRSLRAAILGHRHLVDNHTVLHNDIDVHSIRLYPDVPQPGSLIMCPVLADTGKAKHYEKKWDSELWFSLIAELGDFYRVLYKIVFGLDSSKEVEKAISSKPEVEKLSTSWASGPVRHLVMEIFDAKQAMSEKDIVKNTELGEVVDPKEFALVTNEFYDRTLKAIDEAPNAAAVVDKKVLDQKDVEVAVESVKENTERDELNEEGAKNDEIDVQGEPASKAQANDEDARKVGEEGNGARKARVSLGGLQENVEKGLNGTNDPTNHETMLQNLAKAVADVEKRKKEKENTDTAAKGYRGLGRIKKNKRAFDGEDDEHKEKRARKMD